MSCTGVAVAPLGYTRYCRDCHKAKGTNCRWRADNPDRDGCPQVYQTFGNVITKVLGDSSLRSRLDRDILLAAVAQCEQWQVKDRAARPICAACDDTGEVWAEMTRVLKPYVTVYLAPRPCPRCAMGAYAKLLYQDAGLPCDWPQFGYGPADDPHHFTYDARGKVSDHNEVLPEVQGTAEEWLEKMKRLGGKQMAAGGA